MVTLTCPEVNHKSKEVRMKIQSCFQHRVQLLNYKLDRKGQRTCQCHTNVVLQFESPFLFCCSYAHLVLVSLDFILLTNPEDRLLSASPLYSKVNVRSLSVGTVAKVLKRF